MLDAERACELLERLASLAAGGAAAGDDELGFGRAAQDMRQRADEIQDALLLVQPGEEKEPARRAHERCEGCRHRHGIADDRRPRPRLDRVHLLAPAAREHHHARRLSQDETQPREC